MLMLGALSRALETKYSGGDRHSAENPPHWTTTRLNLPGSIDYDPGISWIKQRPKIQNDGIMWEETGPGEDLTWKSGLVWRYFQLYLGHPNILLRMHADTGTWARSASGGRQLAIFICG